MCIIPCPIFRMWNIPQKLPSCVIVWPPQKNSWNQINQFHEKIFWPNSIFCNFKNGQKSIFELGKSLKMPKMQFHEKFFGFIWFYEFLVWTFLNFLAGCAMRKARKPPSPRNITKCRAMLIYWITCVYLCRLYFDSLPTSRVHLHNPWYSKYFKYQRQFSIK